MRGLIVFGVPLLLTVIFATAAGLIVGNASVMLGW